MKQFYITIRESVEKLYHVRAETLQEAEELVLGDIEASGRRVTLKGIQTSESEVVDTEEFSERIKT